MWSGTAAQVEQALFIGLNVRERPDGSHFYAVDADPSLDFRRSRCSGSVASTRRVLSVPGGGVRLPPPSGAGTGPNGFGNSGDIRAAYASCSASANRSGAEDWGCSKSRTGSRRTTSAPTNARRAAPPATGRGSCHIGRLPTINVVSLDGATGGPVTVNGSFEVALDIEMAVAMAPGLAPDQCFETPNTGNVKLANDILTGHGDDIAAFEPTQQLMVFRRRLQYAATSINWRSRVSPFSRPPAIRDPAPGNGSGRHQGSRRGHGRWRHNADLDGTAASLRVGQ